MNTVSVHWRASERLRLGGRGRRRQRGTVSCGSRATRHAQSSPCPKLHGFAHAEQLKRARLCCVRSKALRVLSSVDAASVDFQSGTERDDDAVFVGDGTSANRRPRLSS